MRMSDWSSDVCSSDLSQPLPLHIPKSILARTAEPSPRHDLHRYSQLHASFPIVKNETLEPRSQLRPVTLTLNLELNLPPSTTPSPDRNSVVSVTSVSLLLSLCVLLIIT